MEKIRTSLDNIQKKQITDWLRDTDVQIRAGRYLLADDILQKIFSLQPDNTVAHSYQDRIQFLIKQLSQRVGLDNEICEEIRKYRELVLKRKTNQISSFLNTAHKLLEEGHFKKASDQAIKALAIDPENVFAKGLLQRLEELQNRSDNSIADTEKEYQFCATFKNIWKDGIPNEDQQELINQKQKELKISNGKRLELERATKNELYRNSLTEIWNTGGLSAFTPESIDALRKKFTISRIDHSAIESTLLKQMRKNKIKGNILVVDEDESVLIEVSGVLRSNFYAVIAAGTFDEALESLNIATPDIIISELHFQSEPIGFELFEFIRKKRANKHVPFIFMASSLDRTTQIIGKRLGVEEFIQKPIDHELLVAVVDGMRRLSTEHQPQPKVDERFLARSFAR